MERNNPEEIYEKIHGKLKGLDGKIIAIDLETGDYFIGKNTIEAYEKGQKKYPKKEFLFKRIGSKTAFFVGLSRK